MKEIHPNEQESNFCINFPLSGPSIDACECNECNKRVGESQNRKEKADTERIMDHKNAF